MYPFASQPVFFMPPQQQPAPTKIKKRSVKKALEEVVELKKLLEEMEKKEKDGKDKKPDDKKPEDKKSRWTPFEVAAIMLLLSPATGAGMLQLYAYFYHTSKAALSTMGAN